MLDYSLDKEKAKMFILNYEIMEDSIKVNLASGDDYFVPKTKEHELSIIKQMEKQVNDAWQFEEKQKKRRKSSLRWFSYDCAFVVFNAIVLCFGYSTMTLALCGIFVGLAGTELLIHRDAKRKLADIKKHEYFLKMKNLINSYLEKGNVEIKENTVVPVKSEEKDIITINDVHNMSYSDLDKIVNDMNRDTVLGIDRPKVMLKQYLPNQQKKK